MNIQWRKSSYSGGTGQCVEVAQYSQAIAVRDSKNPGGGMITVTPGSWEFFTRSLKGR